MTRVSMIDPDFKHFYFKDENGNEYHAKKSGKGAWYIHKGERWEKIKIAELVELLISLLEKK